jgi:hypothetical protein
VAWRDHAEAADRLDPDLRIYTGQKDEGNARGRPYIGEVPIYRNSCPWAAQLGILVATPLGILVAMSGPLRQTSRIHTATFHAESFLGARLGTLSLESVPSKLGARESETATV